MDFNVLLMVAGNMGFFKLFIDSKMLALLADIIMAKVPNVQIAAIIPAYIFLDCILPMTKGV